MNALPCPESSEEFRGVLAHLHAQSHAYPLRKLLAEQKLSAEAPAAVNEIGVGTVERQHYHLPRRENVANGERCFRTADNRQTVAPRSNLPSLPGRATREKSQENKPQYVILVTQH